VRAPSIARSNSCARTYRNTADAGYVELGIEQRAEAAQALRRRDARPEHLKSLFAERIDEIPRVFRRRLARRGEPDEAQGEQDDRGATTNHLAEPP